MKKSAVLAAALAFLCASPAVADYKAEYKAYKTALESGDYGAALKHGEEAWRQAEAELGDHEKTAILAYNFAVLAYDFDRAKALAAFRRSLALTERSFGALPAADIRLGIANCDLALDVPNKEKAAALRSLLEAQVDTTPVTFNAAEGWRLAGLHELNAKKFNAAKKSSDKARAIAEKLSPQPKRLIAESLAIGGISRVIGNNSRTNSTIVEAVELLDRAIVMFPPQKSIDSFDPLFSEAMLWRFAIDAMAESEDREQALKRIDKELDADAMCRWEQSRPADCEIVWEARTPPRYSAEAIKKSLIGSVLVGYDLNETGVERSVLIGALNGDALSKAAIKSMATWKLKQPVPEACRKNHVTVFKFVIKYR